MNADESGDPISFKSDRSGTKIVERQKVDGPDPNYWRVWISGHHSPRYCVADGVGRFRSWLVAAALRKLTP